MQTRTILVVAALVVGGACNSDRPPTGPTPPPPPAGVVLQIHTRGAMVRIGERETMSLTLSQGGDVTGQAVVESSNPAVFAIEDNRRIVGVGPGEGQIRATYQNLTQSIPQVVVAIGPTPNGMPSIANPSMVINEFRTSGPRGAADEFIELRNISSAPVDLAGWSIAMVTSGGHRESFGLVLPPATVSPGCHYLLAGHSGPNAYSSGSLAIADFRWSSTFFQDDVSFALMDTQGRIIDQVGLSAAAVYVETAPLAPLIGRSRERVADTNHNAADFRTADADSPRSLQSACS